MKKGVSAIIKSDNGSRYFLVLRRIESWTGWEFPKGGLEDGETPEQAVLREVKEETGLNAKINKKLNINREFTNKGEVYCFDIFLMEANMNYPVRVEKKVHDNFLWAQPSRIMELLYWEDERNSFEKVLKVLKNG